MVHSLMSEGYRAQALSARPARARARRGPRPAPLRRLEAAARRPGHHRRWVRPWLENPRTRPLAVGPLPADWPFQLAAPDRTICGAAYVNACAASPLVWVQARSSFMVHLRLCPRRFILAVAVSRSGSALRRSSPSFRSPRLVSWSISPPRLFDISAALHSGIARQCGAPRSLKAVPSPTRSPSCGEVARHAARAPCPCGDE